MTSLLAFGARKSDQQVVMSQGVLSEQKKRRQHYVWRKYLEAWCIEQKLWCLRKGHPAPFQANPINVAVEKDFYRVQPVKVDDLSFIKELAIVPSKNDTLRRLNEGLLGKFSAIFSVIELAGNSGTKNSEIQEAVDLLLNNLEEESLASVL